DWCALNIAAHSSVHGICANYLISLMFFQALFPDSLLVSSFRYTPSSRLTMWDAAWRSHGTAAQIRQPELAFPFVPPDWEHTPAAVQAYVYTLQDTLTQLRERVEALESRLQATSTTSQRPPLIRLALQEATSAYNHDPRLQSGWKTGPSRSSTGTP